MQQPALIVTFPHAQRTYGPWWQCCPSAAQKLKKASENFISQDFVGGLTTFVISLMLFYIHVQGRSQCNKGGGLIIDFVT